MRMNPDRLKEFIEGIDEFREDYDDVETFEPEIKGYLDKARGWAKLKYDRVCEPRHADPTKS